MTRGEIAPFDVPFELLRRENSSYQSVFQGPIVRCTKVPARITTQTIVGWRPKVQYFALEWNRDIRSAPNTMEFRITESNPVGYSIVTGGKDGTLMLVLEEHATICNAYVATYTTNLAYLEGARHVTYSIQDEQILNFSDIITIPLSIEDITYLYYNHFDPKRASGGFEEWKKTLSTWRYQSNSVAILDALFRIMEFTDFCEITMTPFSFDGRTYRLPNGTEVELFKMDIIASSCTDGTSTMNDVPYKR
jgi:hypothetical protein